MSGNDGRRLSGHHRQTGGETRRHQLRVPRPGRLPERNHRRLSAQLPLVPRRRGAGAVPRIQIRHSGFHQQRRRPLLLRRSAGRRTARSERPARSAGQPQTLQESGGIHLRHGSGHRYRGEQRTQPRRQLVRRDLLSQAQEDARHYRRRRRRDPRREARLRRVDGQPEPRAGTEGPLRYRRRKTRRRHGSRPQGFRRDGRDRRRRHGYGRDADRRSDRHRRRHHGRPQMDHAQPAQRAARCTPSRATS